MIVELGSSHLKSLVQIAEQVLSRIENKAFFNWTAESLTEEMKHSKGFVQLEQQQVMGFLFYRESFDFYEVMVLATSPAQQRAGAMTALIRELQQCAARQNKPILLEVHIDNIPACNLYSKLGFKKQSLRKNYYKDGGACVLFKYDV